MLHDLIVTNREQIIGLARQRARERVAFALSEPSAEHGIPRFLSQLADTLAPGAPGYAFEDQAENCGIKRTAALHGHELLENGFSIAQVVHGYGDVCQIVTELAANTQSSISAADFRVFNRCLDDAIAGAATAYEAQREVELSNQGTESLGVLVHEIRNLLNTAILSFEVIRKGSDRDRKAGTVHARALSDLRSLVERSLAKVRLEAGIPRLEKTYLADFISRVAESAKLEATVRGVTFNVDVVDTNVVIDVDRPLLDSALMNLLQNAFKFSRPAGHVSLTTRATPERVSIEVADECGGLPPATAEAMFRPFVRSASNQSGLGLGLSISLGAVRANGGELVMRDVPGTGCIFTITLPRAAS